MSAIIVENGLVHYEALGRGQPVLFLHGWIGSWRYWMPTMEAVSDRYRTYAFDLWGFGDSDKSSQRYEIDSYVSLVGLFMDELGLVKAPIIGHSLGAVVGMLFAARWPERVDKLMTISMPLHSSLINRKLIASSDGLLDRTIGRKQAQQAYPEVAQEAGKADPNVVALSTRSMTDLDLRLEIDSITRPILMVHGEKDVLVAPPPPETVQDLEENVRQIILRDSLHFPMLDEATKFHRLVRDFLDSDPASLVLKDEWKRRSR